MYSKDLIDRHGLSLLTMSLLLLLTALALAAA